MHVYYLPVESLTFVRSKEVADAFDWMDCKVRHTNSQTGSLDGTVKRSIGRPVDGCGGMRDCCSWMSSREFVRRVWPALVCEFDPIWKAILVVIPFQLLQN